MHNMFLVLFLTLFNATFAFDNSYIDNMGLENIDMRQYYDPDDPMFLPHKRPPQPPRPGTALRSRNDGMPPAGDMGAEMLGEMGAILTKTRKWPEFLSRLNNHYENFNGTVWNKEEFKPVFKGMAAWMKELRNSLSTVRPTTPRVIMRIAKSAEDPSAGFDEYWAAGGGGSVDGMSKPEALQPFRRTMYKDLSKEETRLRKLFDLPPKQNQQSMNALSKAELEMKQTYKEMGLRLADPKTSKMFAESGEQKNKTPPRRQAYWPPDSQKPDTNLKPPNSQNSPPNFQNNLPVNFPNGPPMQNRPPFQGYQNGPRGFPNGPGDYQNGPQQGMRNGPQMGYQNGLQQGMRNGPQMGYQNGPQQSMGNGQQMGYQNGPQMGYQNIPLPGQWDGQGYNAGVSRNSPIGYQNGPMGYNNVPSMGYNNGPPMNYQFGQQGYPNGPQGYQNVQSGYQNGLPMSYRDGPPLNQQNGPPMNYQHGPPMDYQEGQGYPGHQNGPIDYDNGPGGPHMDDDNGPGMDHDGPQSGQQGLYRQEEYPNGLPPLLPPLSDLEEEKNLRETAKKAQLEKKQFLRMAKELQEENEARIPPPPPRRPSPPQRFPPTTQNPLASYNLPSVDDYRSPIRWVKFNSDPDTGTNRQYTINGTIYVPIIDQTKMGSRNGLTTMEIPNQTEMALVRRQESKVEEKKPENWLEQHFLETPQDRYSPIQCGIDGCRAKCMTEHCKTRCLGDTCTAGCKGAFCSAECSGPGCKALCLGEQCSAKCDGMSCEAKCRKKECTSKCRGFTCYMVENEATKREIGTFDEHYPDYDTRRPRNMREGQHPQKEYSSESRSKEVKRGRRESSGSGENDY